MEVKREDELRNDEKSISDDRQEEDRKEAISHVVEEVVVESRSERFVETTNEVLLMSGNLNELYCFYQGDLVAERMTAVRQSIYHIRKNWSKFDQFLNSLSQFMEQKAVHSGGLSNAVKAIFTRRRNWCDLENMQESFLSLKDEFNIIHTYTTKIGFQEIFKVSDSIFRTDSSVEFQDVIRNAVFLIELINIDLFNFVKKCPQFSNFEGIVYRGMAIPQSSFSVFEALMNQPISKRYISIPLGLWSSSSKINEAVNFVKQELVNNPGNTPLLLEIHVLNLEESFLSYYRKKFKNKSIVSTICAVPIHEISEYPSEAEVLLRGGFFNALNFYTRMIDGVEFKILALVALNSNRDHLSTPTFLSEDEDRLARTLFGTMIGVTRNRFVIDYYKSNNIVNDDLEKYKMMLEEGEEKLKTLMSPL